MVIFRGYRGYLFFFSVRSNFIITEGTPKAVFSRVAIATKPRVKIQVFVFMSEIKFDLTLKKIKFSVSFMLLFAIIKLLPTLRLSRQKTNFFSRHFASI